MGMYNLPDIGPGIPPVLTPSGGHHNTYGWQAGNALHTGMFSCLNDYHLSTFTLTLPPWNKEKHAQVISFKHVFLVTKLFNIVINDFWCKDF